MEVFDGTCFCVVLDSCRDFWRHVPRDLDTGLESEALARARTAKRPGQVRIDREIQPALLALEDRPNLERARVGLELRLVEAHLEADADLEREAFDFRQPKSRTDAPPREF